jgi:ribosomal protein S18 acetylase RimI-like enzyme
MDMTLRMRNFEVDDWATLRDLRLRALADAPDAFGSTLEAEERMSEADWIGRAAPPADSPPCINLIAELGEEPVGLAYACLDAADPGRANLYAMWVDPSARRSGLGRAIVERVADWALSAGAERLVLEVTEGNRAALGLYEREGFALTGERSPLRPGSSLYVQAMQLDLLARKRGAGGE